MFRERTKTTHIIVHCSATKPTDGDVHQQLESMRAYHKSLGWTDIGYHKIIGQDGTVVDGRPIDVMGAHVRGHNHNSIGICLIGGYGGEANQEFLVNFTPAQLTALEDQIERIKEKYPDIKDANILGHNKLSLKACPCFDVEKVLFGIEHNSRPPIQEEKKVKLTQSTAIKSSSITIGSATAGIATVLGAAGTLDAELAELVLIGIFLLVLAAGLWSLCHRFFKWFEGHR